MAATPEGETVDASARLGHNAGPPLDDDEGPPWGDGDPYLYFCWDRAWRQAWKGAPYDIMMRRLERAEALGLTYEEYTLEVLERGRHLQTTDAERIKAIKRARFWR
jgi:hypothetical protein